jgi:hypothetical protein
MTEGSYVIPAPVNAEVYDQCRPETKCPICGSCETHPLGWTTDMFTGVEHPTQRQCRTCGKYWTSEYVTQDAQQMPTSEGWELLPENAVITQEQAQPAEVTPAATTSQEPMLRTDEGLAYPATLAEPNAYEVAADDERSEE